MPESELLPLFPLELVLLPGAELALHIFEPRYRQMVGSAWEFKSEFGVVMAEKSGLQQVGCTAIVEEVTQRYEDGRFDVATRGMRRFRVVDVDQSREFLQAKVEYFEDEPSPPIEPADVKRLFDLAQQAAKLTNTQLERAFIHDDPLPSFQAAAALPLDLALKQQLLISRSETERVVQLTSYLQAWVAKRRATEIMKNRAQTNGRAH